MMSPPQTAELQPEIMVTFQTKVMSSFLPPDSSPLLSSVQVAVQPPPPHECGAQTWTTFSS